MKLKNRMRAMLVVLVISVVPLVVSAYHFQTGLSQYSWSSSGEDSYDFFLYWKGFLLVCISLIMAMWFAAAFIRDRKNLLGRAGAKYMVPVCLYLLFAVVSTVCSEHKSMAVYGGYEQWEGIIIIGAYVIVLLFSYLMLCEKIEFRIVMWGFLIGVFALSLVSAMQAFGYDFLRTEAGHAMMNFMSDKKLNFTFNFEVGRVYSTLHNPNYVGSYVALVLPVILSLVSWETRGASVVRSILAGISAICLVLMLAGSQSVTGFIGVFCSLLVYGVYWFIQNRAQWKRVLLSAACCVVVVALIVVTNKPVFEYGYNKMLHPTPNHFLIKSMESREGCLYITTAKDDVLVMKTGRWGEEEKPYEVRDGAGRELPLVYDEEKDVLKVTDDRFDGIELHETVLTEDGTAYEAVKIQTPSMNKTYTVAKKEASKETQYAMHTTSGKLDELRHIESIGFENKQHFGSRRGYIWSRTFPLLRKHLLLGSGPSTFVYEFPNYDYVGRTNVGYEWSVVTKPHNMYLQIWVQTGLPSLLMFLAMYLVYFVESIRLYFRRKTVRHTDIIGLGIMLGTIGYLVTGLANDSCVAVAPLYWALLGAGMAVNRYNRNTTNQ